MSLTHLPRPDSLVNRALTVAELEAVRQCVVRGALYGNDVCVDSTARRLRIAVDAMVRAAVHARSPRSASNKRARPFSGVFHVALPGFPRSDRGRPRACRRAALRARTGTGAALRRKVWRLVRRQGR